MQTYPVSFFSIGPLNYQDNERELAGSLTSSPPGDFMFGSLSWNFCSDNPESVSKNDMSAKTQIHRIAEYIALPFSLYGPFNPARGCRAL